MDKVYVRWNPLHERVVCVHTNEDDSCPACDKAREDIKNSPYFLEGNWFKVDSDTVNNIIEDIINIIEDNE